MAKVFKQYKKQDSTENQCVQPRKASIFFFEKQKHTHILCACAFVCTAKRTKAQDVVFGNYDLI